MTVGDLLRSGGRLAIQCTTCSRFRYLNAARYNERDLVAEIGKRLRCMGCLSPDVDARCIMPDANGRWRAEGS